MHSIRPIGWSHLLKCQHFQSNSTSSKGFPLFRLFSPCASGSWIQSLELKIMSLCSTKCDVPNSLHLLPNVTKDKVVSSLLSLHLPKSSRLQWPYGPNKLECFITLSWTYTRFIPLVEVFYWNGNIFNQTQLLPKGFPSFGYFLPVQAAAGFKPLNSGSWAFVLPNVLYPIVFTYFPMWLKIR